MMKSRMTDNFKKLLCVILTSLIIIGMSPIGVFADYYMEQNISILDLIPPPEGLVTESDANHFFYYRLSNKELYIRLKRNIAVEDKNIIATITASKEGKFPSDVVAINCDIMVYSILFSVVKGESSTLRIINDGGSDSDTLKIYKTLRYGGSKEHSPGSNPKVIIETNVEAANFVMPYNDHSELIIEKTGNFTVNSSVSVDTVTVEEGGALSINGDLNLTESLEIKEGGTLKTTGAIKVVSTEDIAPEEMIKLPDNYLPDGYSVQKVEDSSGKYYYAIVKDGEKLTVDDDGNLSGVSSNIPIVPPAEPEPEEKTDYMMVTVLMYMLQNSHTIRFETNGGSELIPQMKLDGTEIAASDYVTEREGCTFAGWYFDEELTEVADVFSLISDVTLWAAWEADEAEADDDVEAEPAE